MSREEAGSKRGGFWNISPLGTVALLAVGVVLFCFTVPRLYRFALQENEWDAVHASRLLAQAAQGLETPPAGGIAHLFEEAGLRREMPDVEFLGDGQLLRNHGYYFRLAIPGQLEELGDGAGDGSWEPIVLAWPCRRGLTGSVVLAARARVVLAHPDASGWSGPDGSPPVPTIWGGSGPNEGWRRLRN